LPKIIELGYLSIPIGIIGLSSLLIQA